MRAEQIAQLERIRATRDEGKCQSMLAALREFAAKKEGNLLEAAIAAARARATLGEISQAMEDVLGRHRARTQVISGVYADNYGDDPQFAAVADRVGAFRTAHGRAPSLLIAKLGQDGHDRGAKVIASAFADLGFAVHMGELFATAPEVAALADDLRVDAVGISTLAAAHRTLVPELLAALKDRDLNDLTVVVGGVIPQSDYDFLYQAGVAAIFGPGTNVLDAALSVLREIDGTRSNHTRSVEHNSSI